MNADQVVSAHNEVVLNSEQSAFVQAVKGIDKGNYKIVSSKKSSDGDGNATLKGIHKR